MAKKATKIDKRLEYLRGELRAERISWDELHELQSHADYLIEIGDQELMEAAGVPEDQHDRQVDSFERAVSDRFVKVYGITWADACGMREPLEQAMADGMSPEAFVDEEGEGTT